MLKDLYRIYKALYSRHTDHQEGMVCEENVGNIDISSLSFIVEVPIRRVNGVKEESCEVEKLEFQGVAFYTKD